MKYKSQYHKSQSILAAILILVLLIIIFSGCAKPKQSQERYQEALSKAQNYLYEKVPEPFCNSVGGEWLVVALARSGFQAEDTYWQKYEANVTKTVQQADGVLHTPTGYKYTEYARIILAWTAIGKNPQDVAGYDFLERLDDMENVCRQGINGPIWALIAFDCGGYKMPDSRANDPVSREALVSVILEAQLSDGSWGLVDQSSDVDLTAMALTALAPYYLNEEEANQIQQDTLAAVHSAVDAGLTWLSEQQKDSGGFESWGSENAESIAQVLTALSALDLDGDKESLFVKKEGSVLDALLSFQTEEGGFSHEKSGETNQMASEQCCYALAAYDRFCRGESRLYDMKL